MVLIQYLMALDALMQLINLSEEWQPPLWQEDEEEVSYPKGGDSPDGFSGVEADFIINLTGTDYLVREGAPIYNISLVQSLERERDVAEKIWSDSAGKISTIKGTVLYSLKDMEASRVIREYMENALGTDNTQTYSLYNPLLWEINSSYEGYVSTYYTPYDIYSAVYNYRPPEIRAYGGYEYPGSGGPSHMLSWGALSPGFYSRTEEISSYIVGGEMYREITAQLANSSLISHSTGIHSPIVPGFVTVPGERRYISEGLSPVHTPVSPLEGGQNREMYDKQYSDTQLYRFITSENGELSREREVYGLTSLSSLISSGSGREGDRTVNINVDFTANASISNDYDVDRFTARFADRLREELAGCGEGVHLY